jgi:Beta-propeller repeat.
MIKYFIYLMFLLVLISSYGCGDSSGNEESQSLPSSSTDTTGTWTKQLGTSRTELAYGVATDSSGKVYVTGNTGGGLDGNDSAGSSDLFLVKYNSSGTKQ